MWNDRDTDFSIDGFIEKLTELKNERDDLFHSVRKLGAENDLLKEENTVLRERLQRLESMNGPERNLFKDMKNLLNSHFDRLSG